MAQTLIDLAAARLGGRALKASDEFFAPKANLLQPGRGVFIEGKYTPRGKWMDGWETRRRRGPPDHDWCIIRLGAPGVIRKVTVDTNHFRGNHPEAASVEGATDGRTWVEILPRVPLAGRTENVFAVKTELRATHVRLNIYPDGGVARLRAWGEPRPDWTRLRAGKEPIDLVAAALGGVPLAASDQFFSEPLNLLLPGRPANMGDGWETRRRRGPGFDWVVLKLGHRGVIEAAEVDTTHFKGNYPESCRLEGAESPAVPDDTTWRELLPRTRLGPHRRHRIPIPAAARRPVTHVRLSIFPDGGVARLRLWGRPVPVE